MNVLISCETGGEAVPAQFTTQDPTETTSINSDPLALLPGQLPETLSRDVAADYVARRMAEQLGVQLICNRHSQDLIDVTRSLHHRWLFPPLTRTWDADNRQRLIDAIHQPYRRRLKDEIAKMLVRAPYVVHLSIGTFDLRSKTGKLRRADIGMLYDPAVDEEVNLCVDWFNSMYDDAPMLKVRRNYPRRGTADNITKAMRREFSANYIGIEVLLNRAWAARPVAIRDQAIDGICQALRVILETDRLAAA